MNVNPLMTKRERRRYFVDRLLTEVFAFAVIVISSFVLWAILSGALKWTGLIIERDVHTVALWLIVTGHIWSTRK